MSKEKNYYNTLKVTNLVKNLINTVTCKVIDDEITLEVESEVTYNVINQLANLFETTNIVITTEVKESSGCRCMQCPVSYSVMVITLYEAKIKENM